LRAPTEKPSTGGFALTTLKKLYGARFVCPSLSIVDTQAIGRGITASRSSRYRSSAFRSVATMAWSGMFTRQKTGAWEYMSEVSRSRMSTACHDATL